MRVSTAVCYLLVALCFWSAIRYMGIQIDAAEFPAAVSI